MNQTGIRIFSAISIFIGAAVWLALFSFSDFDVLSIDSLKSLNSGIVLSGIFWFTYFTWGWKYKYIRKLMYKPNINGTWLGEFTSDWKNSEDKENSPKLLGGYFSIIKN